MDRDKYIEQCVERMRAWMELRSLAPATVSVYLRCGRSFMEQVGKPLGEVTGKDVEEYLLTLARKERSPITRNVNLAAIRCAFRSTLGRDPAEGVPQAKVARRSPEILSGTEVNKLLKATRSPKYRAIFMLAYGAGLRVGELAALKTSDIDSDRMLIHVGAGKTGPRYVMLSPRLLEALRAYWRAYRPKGPYLFPGGHGGKSHERHITRVRINKTLSEIARAAGIAKPVWPHLLRHSFATHLLESGANPRRVQVLLGHARLESTARYLHLTTTQLRQVPSPLDLIGTDKGKPLG